MKIGSMVKAMAAVSKGPLGLMMVLSLSTACNKSSMSGSNSKISKKPSDGGSDDRQSNSETKKSSGTNRDEARYPDLDLGTVSKTLGTDDNSAPIRILKDSTKAAVLVRELEPQSDQFAWTVTQTGTVTFHKIAEKKVVSAKKWSGATSTNGGGARTYVIEGGGLVVARTGGEMFFVDPAMPEGTNLRTLGDPYFIAMGSAKNLVDAGKPIGVGERVCLVSYKRDGKRYLGFGWGAGHFAEVPQKDTSPYAPIWQEVQYKGSAGPGQWGYSCFIDQNKLVYYGRFVGASAIQAFDIKTSTPATPSVVAANGLFSSSTLPALSLGPKNATNGSYAISGDPRGNVFNGDNVYTMSFEPKNKVVWATSGNAREITVAPADCLSTKVICVGHATFPLIANIGPISALGDGTLVGVTRYAPNLNFFLYLLELSDPTDPSKGMKPPLQLAQLDGDPYMYTDFTGATLYLTKSEIKIRLSDGGYDPSRALRAIGFTWLTKDLSPLPWLDIQLEMRCYLSSATPPDYDPVSVAIKPATDQTVITTNTCTEGTKNIDTIDVRLTQLNAATTLMNVRKIQVTAYQF